MSDWNNSTHQQEYKIRFRNLKMERKLVQKGPRRNQHVQKFEKGCKLLKGQTTNLNRTSINNN